MPVPPGYNNINQITQATVNGRSVYTYTYSGVTFTTTNPNNPDYWTTVNPTVNLLNNEWVNANTNLPLTSLTIASPTMPTSYTTAPEQLQPGVDVQGSAITTINNISPTETPEQLLTLTPTSFLTNASAGPINILQSRAQQPYSNRQFVSPINIALNVEGVYLQVDFLQKPISSNSYNIYKQNSVLSTNQSLITSNIVAANNSKDRNSRTLTTVNNNIPQFASQSALSQSIFNNGVQAITQTITSRIPNIGSFINKIPSSSSALSDLNAIPGTVHVTNALTQITTNPLGTVQTLVKASGINLQGGLPSVSIESLGQVFNLASNIASSGPPPSLQGIITAEQQIKSLICNFKPPTVNFGFLKNLDQILQKQPNDASEQLQHQKNIQKQGDQQNFLQLSWAFIKTNIIDKLPKPSQLWAAVTTELTTCDSGTNSKQNDLSGKGNSPAGFKYVVPNANAGQGPINQ
jgi:hypothetical protein